MTDNTFKAYVIRRLCPREIDPDVMRRVGFVHTRDRGPAHLVIDHDMRDTSAGLARAFAAGARTAGSGVSNIGLVTAPMLYTASIERNLHDGATIMQADAAAMLERRQREVLAIIENHQAAS